MGLSPELRIPKDLVNKYKLKDNKEAAIIPEERGIKIVPS